jgi:hypothetical protein
MTDEEYRGAVNELYKLVTSKRFEEACRMRDRIRDAGRKAPVIGFDDETPEMALMRKVYADMQAGVPAAESV